MALRNSRKHRIHKRISRTRKIKNYAKKQNQKGGTLLNHNPEINVSYDNGKLQVVNGKDLTYEWHNEQIKSPPDINIINTANTEKDKTYLITMTDPDALNGQGASENHTWTHWLAIMKNGTLKKILVPYQQPSLPQGIHRYEIKVSVSFNRSKILKIIFSGYTDSGGYGALMPHSPIFHP